MTDITKELAEALDGVLSTLQRENATQGGAIRDTIWHTPHQTLFDFIASALASYRSQAEGDGWLPIETAPRDGTIVLLSMPLDDNTAEILTAGWDNGLGGWCDNAHGTLWGFDATHWRPLPAAPSPNGEKQG